MHILTQHFGTDAWFEIQKNHLEKYTLKKERYKVYLATYKTSIPDSFILPPNYVHINLNEHPEFRNEHYLIIEEAYEKFVKPHAKDNDIIIYMDNDAFPCDSWEDKLESYLTENDICAVYRYEDRGLDQPDQYFPYPHLCFFSFKKKTRDMYGFKHEIPEGFPCPGFTICDVIRQNNLKVKELIRTNKFNSHNVMFGIYDDMIYHHSSGSRAKVGRPYATLGAKSDHRKMCYEGIDFFLRQDVLSHLPPWIETEVNDVNLKIFDVIFDKIKDDKDCNFVRRFYLGKY